jgi:hypothetical protein
MNDVIGWINEDGEFMYQNVRGVQYEGLNCGLQVHGGTNPGYRHCDMKI